MTKKNIELRASHESMENDINNITIEKIIILDDYELELELESKNEDLQDKNDDY